MSEAKRQCAESSISSHTGLLALAPQEPTIGSARALSMRNSLIPDTCKYAIVTPVRDEEKFVEQTIRAVVNQTVKPVEWVIVDDGSTDATGQILDRYASQVPWIRVVHRNNRGFRKSGAGVVEAFYEGYKAVQSRDWDFIVKLDGDLTFTSDYFQKMFEQFEKAPRLGIGGGTIYNASNGTQTLEEGPRFHVRGATKIYRRECWEAIQGLHVAPGWDTIDEVKANMLGWQTETFRQLQILQHRPTGKAEGWWRDRVKNGKAYYTAGYHPLFFAAKFLYRLASRPYVIGSVAMCYGFLSGYVGGAVRINDPALVRYLRREQMKRLLGRKTIWK
jgi:glycosyltransferase involved in cell wall biosynthesis